MHVGRWIRLGATCVALAAVLVSACSSDDRVESGGDAATSSATPASTTTEPATTPSTAERTPVAPPPPSFEFTVRAIDDATARRMSTSWRPDCPVALADLRLLAVTHIGFAGDTRTGELVVHADVAEDIVSVFRGLYEARFPIDQMRLVDDFGGDDDRSMEANNTSAFNCRKATGSSRWSEHAYGRAVDLNPVQNPYVTRSGAVLPPSGGPFVNRDPAATGLIAAGGPVVRSFDDIGWGWGGRWSSAKDYQHFSASSR